MAPNGSPRKLLGWKEISTYIGKSEDTCRRYAKQRGLPVHRIPGGGVLAVDQELDQWLVSRAAYPNSTAVTAEEPAGAGGEDGSPSTVGQDDDAPREAEAPAGSATDGENGVGPGGHPTPTVEGASPASRWLDRATAGRAPGPAGVLLAIVVAGAFSATAWGMLRFLRNPDRITRIEFVNRELRAFGEDGSLAWRKHFPRALLASTSIPPSERQFVGDIAGDGSQRILFSAPFAEEPSVAARPDGGHDELFCLTANGRELWGTRFGDTLYFNGPPGASRRSIGPPWLSGRIAVYRSRGHGRIAWVQRHTSSFPSLVVALDASGRRTGLFVNSGSIFSIDSFVTPEGPRVVIGGINNARHAAMIALLDGHRLDGSSPEEAGSPYECRSCPAGRPLAYVVVQASELTDVVLRRPLYGYHSTTRYNRVDHTVWQSGRIAATTAEADETGLHAHLELSPTLEVLSASYGAGYWALHRRLELDGFLTHSADACPAAVPRVRRWTAATGWLDAMPAPPASSARVRPSQAGTGDDASRRPWLLRTGR